jgi:hypothetical protein
MLISVAPLTVSKEAPEGELQEAIEEQANTIRRLRARLRELESVQTPADFAIC